MNFEIKEWKVKVSSSRIKPVVVFPSPQSFAWSPAMTPNLHLPVLAPNLYLLAQTPNLYLPAQA